MKLAEALSMRADLQKKISQLKVRLLNNSKMQEGDKTAEDPVTLLEELDENTARLEDLIRRINLTNCMTKDGNLTLTDMIAKRDMMALKISILRDFLNSASEKVDRYSNKEIKIISSVNVSDMQKKVDNASGKLRELDVRIQGLNWNTDLF